MKLTTTIVACIGALFVFSTVASVPTPADAKRYVKNGAYYVKKGKHNYRYYPSARWLWVGSGLGYGAAAVTGNCRYYHRQWVISGKDHWRRKYNYCID